MEYIDVEEFKKQPEEVQEVLKQYHQKYHNLVYGKGIPIMAETELRKFIEDKGYKYIGINNFLECEGKQWNIKAFKSMMQFEPDAEFYCNTPLECYWQVACKIAAESI